MTSTNDSLKQALSRFNGHSKDQYEGVIYKLPHNLCWKDVVDLEGMINLEISATAQGCDAELMARAARLMNMNERAKEEVEIVKQDMIRTATFYSQEHSLLTSYVEKLKCKPSTVYTRGCLTLLFHRLVLCEFTLAGCTKAFSPYISYSYPTSVTLSHFHSVQGYDGTTTALHEEDLVLSSVQPQSFTDSSDSDSDFDD